MTDEISVDDFLFGERIDLGGGRGTVVVEQKPEPVSQTTLEGREDPVERPKTLPAGYIAAVVLRSRSGSDRPHIVTILTFSDGAREVVCTCEAMLSIAKRPEGCWAMSYVRDLTGIPVPGGPA
jgi:hypothetical protein